MTQADQTPDILDSLDAIADYLAEAFEDGEGDVIAAALKDVAQASALGELAAAVGKPVGELKTALMADEFNLDLTLKIMKVVDLNQSGRGA